MSYSRDPNIAGLTHLPSVPYKSHATRLQNLDIWLPEQPPKLLPTNKSTWIIYVHGGAWRDPTQDSLCVVPTIRSLIKKHANLIDRGHIQGIASLNYRLSPYPSHTTDPSAPDDQDRNVRHPSHIQDVHVALEFLIQEYKVERWIGVGHSCGATLLLQLPLIAGSSSAVQRTLEGLVLLAGIYDVPAFLDNHSTPGCPENIAAIYRQIVEGAFGQELREWENVSPVRMGKMDLWGRLVVLGYSMEDELVESQQRKAMLGKYLQEGWVRSEDAREGAKMVETRDLTMGHDEVWEDGGQIADLIAEVVGRLGAKGVAL